MRRLVGTLLTASIAATGVIFAAAGKAEAIDPIASFADAQIGTRPDATAIEWLPDDRIVVLQQNGVMSIARPGQSGFTTALTLSVCSNSERGLLGFTHDPSFMSNRLVYVYYTRPASGAPGGCVNRVSRFTLNGDTVGVGSEVVLLDNISSVAGNHNGGDLDFGSDGFLYVAVGDAGSDPRADSNGVNDAAQDLSLLNGKILRITSSGQPAPGNPLTGAGTAVCATRGNLPSTPHTQCQEIFAWGLRNPFRFAFDRDDGSSGFFINDVGQSTFEEINRGVRGANYGWPEREGPCPRGDTPPCPSTPPQFVDPITYYGRGDGTYITGGAFVPSGLWPAQYDGAYLFADGGTGKLWVRLADGDVDLAAPLASGGGVIVDMTFGFDANGRLVLYYAENGGRVGRISPTGPAASSARNDLRMLPVTPFRAYDTGADGIAPVGVAGGDVFNGTTRHVDLDPPSSYEAALVNVTYADNAGVGFVRLWGTRALRPATSSLNADAPSTVAANTAIVPLDGNGTFLLEATMTGRIVIDVLAWFDAADGPVGEGRYVALPPARLVDSRRPSGSTLDSGSDNPFTRTGDVFELTPAGRVGVPNDATAGAVVLSIAAIAGSAAGGFVGAFPSGSTWSGTSNVNVVAGDVRANMVVVPLGPGGKVSLQTTNIADVAVDVLGYVTAAAASPSTSGLFSSTEPSRLVDTRLDVGLASLDSAGRTIAAPVGGAAAIVQNLTITQPSAPGFATSYPGGTAVPVVSTVNFFPGQTRATLAFTTVSAAGQLGYYSLVPTEAVVDVIGYFST